MFLSMIIPVYNTEKYLAECLDSCLAQDIPYDDYEIICINDGSKDSSLAILRSFEARYPNIVIIDQPNAGVSAARNVGMAAAQGDYIWFIDSDDFILSNCLGYIKHTALQHDPDHIIFSSYFFDQELTEEEKQLKASYELRLNATFSGLWTQIFRRSLLGDLFFFNDITYGEDVLFIRKFCLLEHRSITANEILYFHRNNPASLMNSSNQEIPRLRSNVRGAIEMKKIYQSPGGMCEANANILINFLNNALHIIAKSHHPESSLALRCLKQEKLFPFKKPKECTTKHAYTTTRTDLIGIIYNWICVNSYTYFGFHILRFWNILYSLKKGDRHV